MTNSGLTARLPPDFVRTIGDQSGTEKSDALPHRGRVCRSRSHRGRGSGECQRRGAGEVGLALPETRSTSRQHQPPRANPRLAGNSKRLVELFGSHPPLLSRQRTPRVSPLEGLGERPVEVVNEIEDALAQVLD